MDGFKLHMGQGCLFEDGNFFIIEEFFKRSERIRQDMMWWRNINGISRPGTTNPILGSPKGTWLFCVSTPLGEKDLVNFPDQSQAKRKISSQSFKAVLHR